MHAACRPSRESIPIPSLTSEAPSVACSSAVSWRLVFDMHVWETPHPLLWTCWFKGNCHNHIFTPRSSVHHTLSLSLSPVCVYVSLPLCLTLSLGDINKSSNQHQSRRHTAVSQSVRPPHHQSDSQTVRQAFESTPDLHAAPKGIQTDIHGTLRTNFGNRTCKRFWYKWRYNGCNSEGSGLSVSVAGCVSGQRLHHPRGDEQNHPEHPGPLCEYLQHCEYFYCCCYCLYLYYEY